MELESGRDLLIPKLMLVTSEVDTSVDTEAMEATVDIEAMDLMATDSTRDLPMLRPRLMLLSSMDLMAMLPLLPLTDMLSPPLSSVPMLLPPLTDMEVMEVMDMEDLEPTGKSFPHNKLNSSIKQLLNSKEDLKFP